MTTPGTHPAWLLGARGAPSPHNTQPWRFAPAADGRIVVRWDPVRTLPAGDPTDRDLYLALGAAVESARLRALLAFVPLAFAPAPDDAPATVGTLVPGDDPDASPDDPRMAAMLDRRQTGRAPHLHRPIPTGLADRLTAEAARFGCGFHLMTDRRRLARLARLARAATAAQFADPAVHAELWRWLRLDPHNLAYQRDGLTADCLELRGAALQVARLALPPARMRWLSRLGAHRLLALDTGTTVRRSASMCLLTLAEQAPARGDLVRAGRGLLRLWLLAADSGLTTHPVSALLDRAATVAPTLAVFGCAGRYPAAVYRMGATPPPARAPRLPAAELLILGSPDRMTTPEATP